MALKTRPSGIKLRNTVCYLREVLHCGSTMAPCTWVGDNGPWSRVVVARGSRPPWPHHEYKGTTQELVGELIRSFVVVQIPFYKVHVYIFTSLGIPSTCLWGPSARRFKGGLQEFMEPLVGPSLACRRLAFPEPFLKTCSSLHPPIVSFVVA